MLRCNRYVFTSIILLFHIFPAFFSSLTRADNAKSTAEQYYHGGMEAYTIGDFTEAADSFHESYVMDERSITAYMVSATCLQQENPWCAEDYAKLALKDSPQLKEPFASDAKKILTWATKSKKITII